MTLYLEDLPPGARFALPDLRLPAEDMISFACRYDAQSFHVDPAAAATGPFRGLVASGLQTVAELVRRWVDAVMVGAAGLGSPGIDDIRFLRPVRAGHRYTASAEILSARPSRGDAGRGVLRVHLELRDDTGPVLTVRPVVLIARRRARPAGAGTEEHGCG